MDLQNMYAFSKNDELTNVPLSLYCAKCDHLMRKGELARKFDNATYYHATCPNTPMVQHSAKKRLDTKYDSYPPKLYLQ